MKPERHPNGFADGDLVQLKAPFHNQRPVRVRYVNTTTLLLEDPRAGYYTWGIDDVELVGVGTGNAGEGT